MNAATGPTDRRAWQSRAAWSLVGLCAALAGVHTWLFLGWSAARADTVGWPILTIGTVLGSALGAVIVTRRPGHRVGWLFIIGATCAAVGDPLFAYDAIVTSGAHPDPPQIWQWSTWVARVLDAPEPLLFVVVLFLLFPDGRLPTRRWRPLLWGAIAVTVLFLVVMVVATPPWQIEPSDEDSFYGPVATIFVVVLLCVMLVFVLAAATSVFVRMRRADRLERQQLRWLAWSASLVALGFALAVLLPSEAGLSNWLRVLPLHLGFVGVILAAGLAILRYRLYDLDIVVSRAILVATATAFVAAGYVGLVVGVGQVLPKPARVSFWPSLLATAVVALAFQPLRLWAVRLADRVAYGPRAVPYEALASFARRLQVAPRSADLLQQVAAAVGEAVGARAVTARLDLPGHGHDRSTWRLHPDDERRPDDQPSAALTIEDRGELLGMIEIVMPPGVTMRTKEADLARRLIAQSAIALGNLRLETELAAQVEELARRTSALATSRHEIVQAGDEEKARFASTLSRRVLPHLASLPERLTALARACSGGGSLDLGAEHEAATAALEELRLLVHGMGPDVRQRAAVSQAAVSRSGPNADLVT